jgi:hypothetical protein
VLRERVQHVVEELDVGVDLDRAAVEPQAQIDLRFGRRAFDRRVTIDQLSAPFVVAPLPLGAFVAWR